MIWIQRFGWWYTGGVECEYTLLAVSSVLEIKKVLDGRRQTSGMYVRAATLVEKENCTYLS